MYPLLTMFTDLLVFYMVMPESVPLDLVILSPIGEALIVGEQESPIVVFEGSTLERQHNLRR